MNSNENSDNFQMHELNTNPMPYKKMKKGKAKAKYQRQQGHSAIELSFDITTNLELYTDKTFKT